MKYVLTAALLVLTGWTATGQELDVYLSADSVTVGERFFVSVTARHDFAAGPQFPSVDGPDSVAFGDVEVLSMRTRDSSTRSGGRVDSVVYEVVTFALDTARVGPIPVLFTAGEDTFTVETDVAWVPVISLVPDEADDVRDLAPLVEFPVPLWPYAAAAAALLAAALLVALYLRRRRRRTGALPPPPPPPVPPRQEALERLDALEAVDLSRRENVQPFYDELSGLLRTYVSRRLHVRALESTTGELVVELRRRRLPDESTTTRLTHVLTASDLVKFADAVPPPSQGRELLAVSRSIVLDVESELHPPEETRPEDGPTVQQ